MVDRPRRNEDDGVNRSKETDMPNHLLLRLRTRWQRDGLDEKLAYGADPTASGELALRASQLRSRKGRVEIATGIERVLHEVSDQWPPVVSQIVPVHHSAVRENAGDIYALTRRLRGGAPIDVRGAAIASRLISDGSGPLYRHGSGDLAHAVRAARLALDPVAPADWDVAAAA
jgi:hypothetical protein